MDKRIVERELKSAEEKIRVLTSEIDEMNSSARTISREHNEAVDEIKGRNESLLSEMNDLKNAMKDMESSIRDYRDKYELERKSVTELKNELHSAVVNIGKLRGDVGNEVKVRQSLERQIDEIREDNIRLHYTKDMSKQEGDEAKRLADMYRHELENTQLNINVLKEACVLLENQLEEYERLISTHEDRESKLQETTSQLSEDVSELQAELQGAKQEMNEEKTQRLLAETKSKRLQEDVDLLRKECASYKQQVRSYSFVVRLNS